MNFKKKLNLGCGFKFNHNWTNIDFSSTSQDVIAHNLKKGIPFPNDFFDVVYHSHVLEHFSKSEAELFIQECYRVLRPQGILRVVVPDLEQIARIYLQALEKASDGYQEWKQNYQWILLEMYDQTVRNQTGGEMLNFLSKQDLSNQEFVIKRCGTEIKNLILSLQTINLSPPPQSFIKKLIKSIYRILRYPDCRRQIFLKFILQSTELEALKIGQFRQSGEIHQWMYDHYSLSVLLKKYKFENIIRRTAYESYIVDWISFNLDTDSDGSIYKPDSLYLEAIKT